MKTTRVTLIHMGDIHGHLIGRMHLRADEGEGRHLGGLARVYTKIRQIRSSCQHSMLINTGDTIQGSAEALFTRGGALVDILNRFEIDFFAPGNWDFVYGTERFIELFAGPKPRAPWNALAANLYFDGHPYAERTGERVLPPYAIKTIEGIRIGIIGFTTDRGPSALGKHPTRGFKMTSGEQEFKHLVPYLRKQEKVHAVVVISELGLANNIRLAMRYAGIDLVLSSDMHEVTRDPVVLENGTMIIEEGQDGTVLGEIELVFQNGQLHSRTLKSHTITEAIEPDADIAAAIDQIRRPFVTGPHFVEQVNPINGTRLRTPIDTVLGHTAVPLTRADFSDSAMPAVIEGSSHDFLCDAFRAMANADIGAIRGFRFGTHVAPGPITLDDIYHFIPIGPLIAVGQINGKALVKQLEKAAHGCLSSDIAEWSGGWMFGYSGIHFSLDPYQPAGKRISGIQVQESLGKDWRSLDPQQSYRYASFFYRHEPEEINGLEAKNIQIIVDENNDPIDATEVVARYLAKLPNQTARPELNRITLVRPLPKPIYGNPEIQPLCGCKNDPGRNES